MSVLSLLAVIGLSQLSPSCHREQPCGLLSRNAKVLIAINKQETQLCAVQCG